MKDSDNEEEADEFDSVKPYLVSVCPPSVVDDPASAQALPKWELSLQHVHGTFGNRVRGNLFYLGTGEIVFAVGKLCIVQGFAKADADDGSVAAVPRSQRFFSQHAASVQSLAVHPDGLLVASGESAAPGAVLVWSAEEMEPRRRLRNDTRGVSALAFSPDGRLLLALSNAGAHRVSVWEWAEERLLASEDCDAAEQHRILGVRFSPQSFSGAGEHAFVTVGVRHVRFWSLLHERLRSRKGAAPGVAAAPTHTCVGFARRGVSVTGTEEGELWVWRGHELQQRVQAHRGPVFDMANNDAGTLLCSAGKDGVLSIRSLDLELVASLSLAEHAHAQRVTDVLISSVTPEACCIRSVDWSMDRILLGTATCDIFEVTYVVADADAGGGWAEPARESLEVAVLQHAHSRGRVRCVCSHPRERVAATGGDDATVRVWACAEGFLLLSIVDAGEERASALAFSPDGAWLAAGFVGGGVRLLEYARLNGRAGIADVAVGDGIARRRQDTVFSLKFSPQGTHLAVGSRGAFIDLYSTADWALLTTCKGHTGSVTSLDWDVEGRFLQSNSSNDELMFWEFPSGFQVRRVADVRDTEWATWSLRLGYPVLGAFAPGKEASVLALQRQATKPHAMFATGDAKGRIKMFTYPCPRQDDKFVSYSSKMAAVSALSFTHDDSFLIALGGAESAVLIYKMSKLEDIPVSTKDIELILEKPLSDGYGRLSAHNELPATTFSSVKPYLGALFSPTTPLYAEVPPETADARLKLSYLHGYRGTDCRHNLAFLASGEFVYIALGIVVIHSPLENTRSQRFFTKHEGDVISIALHPDGKTVASADAGESPTILVWDSDTLKVKSKLAVFQHDGRWVSDLAGVSCLAFGGRAGKYLASVGRGPDNVVALIDWSSAALLASSSSGCAKVLAVACNPKDSTIVTCGVLHLKFWSMRKTRLQASEAVFGGVAVSRTMQCIDFVAHADFNLTLTGSIDGAVFCWKGSRLLRFFEAHAGPIFELLVTSELSVLSAGEDGRVVFWNIEEVSGKLLLDETSPPISVEPEGNELILTVPARFDRCIRSLAMQRDDILIGTAHNEILHVGLQSKHGRQARTLIAGHGDTATVCVVQHPKRAAVFFSVGQDACLRVWDTPRSTLLRVLDLEERAHAVPTCMHIARSGEQLAVGFDSGAVALVSVHCHDDANIDVAVLAPLDASCRSCQRGRAATVVKFTPSELESGFIAVGAEDGIIDIYRLQEGSALTHAGTCRGHQGAVTQIDWSANGMVLQSSSDAHELLFWEVDAGSLSAAERARGKCKEKRPITCRDLAFPEWTSRFGWPVQDIQLIVPDENRITSVHAASESRTCVVGDTLGRLSLFLFPCVDGSAPFQQVRAHPCAVSCVHMGQHAVFSGSAAGGGVLQWALDSRAGEQAGRAQLEARRDACVRAVLHKAPVGDAGATEAGSERKGKGAAHSEDADDKFFDSFHPYVAAIKAPPGWESSSQSGSMPDNELRLEYVLGYSGMEHSANIFVLRSNELLYHTARLCIIANFDSGRRTQRIFDQHEREIACLALHPKGDIVASAEAGERPAILVWNALSLRSLGRVRPPTPGPVSAACFSADGRVLAALSRGAAARLSFTAWATEILMAESAPEPASILALRCNPVTGTFVTCGINHMAFWRLHGRNLSRQGGIVASKEALTSVAFVGESEHESKTITGGESGRVYVWREDAESLVSQTPHAVLAEHAQPVLGLFADSEGLVSCDKGGHVHTWRVERKELVKASSVVLEAAYSQQTCAHCGSSLCVRAVCRIQRADQGAVLVFGMGNNAICALALDQDGSTPKVLTQGHARGMITCLASHPGRPTFATAGEDRMVVLWNREQRIPTASVQVQLEPTALAFSPDGLWIAVGFATGGLCLLRSRTLEARPFPDESPTPKKAVNAIRYSPDGRLLAVGAADATLCVYSVKMELHEDDARDGGAAALGGADEAAARTQPARMEFLARCKGHSGSVLNLDWSVDSTRIQSESDAYETIVWDVEAAREQQILPVRNAQEHSAIDWDTRTCILTWHTSGLVHPGADMNSIRSSCRSNLGDILSVGDSDGKVRLYRFPCVDRESSCRVYHGHKQHVSKVAFSYDDRHLLSVGSKDQAVMIWQHLVIPGSEGTDQAVKALLKVEQVHSKRDTASVAKEDGFDDVHPFVSSLFSPSSWAGAEASALGAPREVLEMEYVHGFKGRSNHGNLVVLSSGEVAYLAAAAIVVLDVEKNTQRHFCEHQHAVVCIALHPEEDLLASADVGPDGTVLIWRASDFAVLYRARGVHHSVSSCLCFSLDGSKLITANLDHDHTVCLYEWKTKKRLALERSGHHQVVALACHPDGETFVSCGVKHVHFWSETRGHLHSKHGSFGVGRPQTMLAIGFSGETEVACYTITAAQNGCIYVWKDATVHRIVVAHRGPILDMEVTEDGLVTGGIDGLVKLWEEDWTCCLRLDVGELTHGLSGHTQGKEFAVCSVAAAMTDELGTRRLLVGLQSNELFEFSFAGDPQELDVLPGSRLVVQSHAAASIKAVSAHPTRPEFATVGDDKMLRTWDCAGCRALSSRACDAQPQAVAYASSGKAVFVGLSTGAVVTTDDGCAEEFRTVFAKRKSAVSCLRPSSSGRFLAVGYATGYIDIYDVAASQAHASCKGAAGAIEHLDWAATEGMIQANSSKLELLFFDVETGHQVTRSADFRDQEWTTWTCAFGWMVKGLSQQAPDLVAAVRGRDSLVVAGVRSGEVFLNHFPCLSDAEAGKRYRGHAALTALAVTVDGQYVISVGAVDSSIVQWRIEQPAPEQLDQDDGFDSELEGVDSKDLQSASFILCLKRKLDFTDPELESKMIARLAGIMRVRPDKVTVQQMPGDDMAIKVSVVTASAREALSLLDDDFDSVSSRLRKELSVACILTNDEVYRLVKGTQPPESPVPVPTSADDASDLYSDPTLLKPYISNLFQPTGFQEPDASEPDEGMELEYVYGFNGANAIGSVFYLKSDEILYTAASLGVVQERSLATRRQYIFRQHSHEVVGVALHPAREIVCTGDGGPKHQILIWSSTTLEVLSQFSASGAIRCLCFSRDGEKLAVVVETPEESTMEVYDWKGRRRLATEKADKHAVLSVKYNPFDVPKEDGFVTCGVNHLKVWTLRGTMLSSRAWTGEVNTKGRLQPFLCVAVPRKAMLLAGTQRGEIYVFKITPAGPKLEGLVTAHDGPVYDMWASETLVLSCGQDGLVQRWSMDADIRPTKSKPPLLTKLKSSSQIKSSLRSVAFRETASQSTVLIATSTNEIFEIDEKTNKWDLLAQGHSAGAIRALCSDPVNKDRFVTGGDDGTLRVWDCLERRCVHLREVRNHILSADYAADGKMIAVGAKDGQLLLLQSNLEDTLHLEKSAKAGSPILAVKFDPNAQYLAVARQNNTLEILDVEKRCARVTVFKGLSSAVVDIDWDMERRVLRTTTRALELLFWDLKSNAAVHKIGELRDRQWHSHNCTLGWYSSGALSAVDHESLISSIDSTAACPVMAAGSCSGAVHLFRFPSSSPNARSKNFTGHLPGVSCVRFDRESSRLFTSGSTDTCVLQWRVFKTTWDPVVATLIEKGVPAVRSMEDVAAMPLPTPPDEFAPSSVPAAKPENHLVLEYVHGFRGHDTHGTLKGLGSGEVVYNAATLCVVHDANSNHQAFFQLHDNDVISMALHPNASIVATGDCGSSPAVYVWDSETMKSLARLDAALSGFRGPVTALCFSPDGKQLVVATNSQDHAVFVLSWESKTVDFSSPSVKGGRAFACAFQPSGAFFVTCGTEHVTFWLDKNGRPAPKLALFGKHWSPTTMLCAAFCAVDFVQQANKKELAVTGGVDGYVYAFGTFAGGVWRPELLNDAFKAHQGPVFEVCAVGGARADEFLTSGKDGLVKWWKMVPSMDSKDRSKTVIRLEALREWDVLAVFETLPVARKMAAAPDAMFAKSLCLCRDELVVGTDSNEIVRVPISGKGVGRLLASGHRSGGINGVCADPAKPFFLTVGEDALLKLWDVASRSLLSQKRLACAGTAVDLSSDGRVAAVGLHNGKVLIVKVFHESQADGSFFEDVADLEPPRTSCRITSVRFSTAPGAAFLAVGCADSAIHIFQHLPNNEFAFLETAKPELGSGHKGAVVALNWAVSASYLQSTCSQHVVMVWFWGGVSNPTLRHDPSADALRENQWATWSSPVGWHAGGLSGAVEAGERVGGVGRSRSTQHKAVLGALDSGGALLLVPFPFPEAWPSARSLLRGHSRHPAALAFAADDSHLLSVGGPDLAVLQWRHSHAPPLPDPPVLQLTALHAGYERRLRPKLRAPVVPYKPPTTWPAKPPAADPEPEHTLVFEHAYGYRGSDAFGGVQFVRTAGDARNHKWGGEFLYFTGGRAVIHDARQNTQRVLAEELAAIVCQAVCADGVRIATAGGRESPQLCVWRARDGLVLKRLRAPHEAGYAAVCFSASAQGSRLFCVGADPRFTAALYDWTQRSSSPKPLAVRSGGPDPILGVKCRVLAQKDQFVTYGKNHLRFWSLAGEEGSFRLEAARAAFDVHRADLTFLCVAFADSFTYAGTAEGSIYILNQMTVTSVIDAERAHSLAVLDLDAQYGLVVSGGMDGKIKLWQVKGGELELKKAVSQQQIEAYAKGISEGRARDHDDYASVGGCAHLSKITKEQGKIGVSSCRIAKVLCENGIDMETHLLVGTTLNEIFLASVAAQDSWSDFGDKGFHTTLLAQGHFGGVQAVAPHPSKALFATGGLDGTVRVHDAEERVMLALGYYSDGQILCVEWAPRENVDRHAIAAGASRGGVCIFTFTAGKAALEVTHIIKPVDARRGLVSSVRFSPDSQKLAAGSQSGHVDVFGCLTGYNWAGTCEPVVEGGEEAGQICSMDWSEDASALQTLDLGGRHVLWDMSVKETPALYPRKSLATGRDETWATLTVLAGWAVDGVVHGHKHGNPASLDCIADAGGLAGGVRILRGRPQAPCLAVVALEHGALRLHRFPARSDKGYHGFRAFHNGTRAVVGVRFALDGARAYSVSGADMCVIQWSVVHQDEVGDSGQVIRAHRAADHSFSLSDRENFWKISTADLEALEQRGVRMELNIVDPKTESLKKQRLYVIDFTFDKVQLVVLGREGKEAAAEGSSAPTLPVGSMVTWKELLLLLATFFHVKDRAGQLQPFTFMYEKYFVSAERQEVCEARMRLLFPKYADADIAALKHRTRRTYTVRNEQDFRQCWHWVEQEYRWLLAAPQNKLPDGQAFLLPVYAIPFAAKRAPGGAEPGAEQQAEEDKSDRDSDVETLLASGEREAVAEEQAEQGRGGEGEGEGAEGAGYAAPREMEGVAPEVGAPEVSFELESAHGYNGRGCRGNVFFLRTGEVLYPAGSLGVRFDRHGNQQKIFGRHTGVITAMALHSDGETVATGEQGAKPLICVWNTFTNTLIHKFEGEHKHKVSALAFASSAASTDNLLVSVGGKEPTTIAVYDWKEGKHQLTQEAPGERIVAVACNPHYAELKFVSVGVRHVRFWERQRKRLDATKGSYKVQCESKTMLSVAFTDTRDVTLTGSKDGHIVVWRETRAVQTFDALKGPIFDIVVQGGSVLVGGKDDLRPIQMFKTGRGWPDTLALEKVSSALNDGLALEQGQAKMCVRAVAWKGNEVVVGTALNCMHWVGTRPQPTGEVLVKTTVRAHSRGRVAALAVHPSKPLFVTVGDDGFVRVFDLEQRAPVQCRQLGEALSAVAVSPKESRVAVGFRSGELRVLRDVDLADVGGLEREYGTRRCELHVTHRKLAAVNALRYHPEGHLLALAAEDKIVDLYDVVRGYKHVRCLEASPGGHSAPVTSLDFGGLDGMLLLQSAAGAAEVRQWQIAFDGEQVQAQLLGQQRARDAAWFSWSLPAGWPVQGVAPSLSLPSPSACVLARSPPIPPPAPAHASGDAEEEEAYILAAGGADGRVSLLRYPCLSSQARFRSSAACHAGAVAALQFTARANRLVTCGAADQTVLVWKVAQRERGGGEVAGEEGEKAGAEKTRARNLCALVAVSPGVDRLGAVLADTRVTVWGLADGQAKKVASVTGADWQTVNACSFNPQGTLVCSASADKTLRVSEVVEGGRQAAPDQSWRLEGHEDEVTACAFSPNGRRVVSGSLDKTARVWDASAVAAVKCLGVGRGHRKGVLCVAWSDDGKRVCSGSMDHSLLVYEVRADLDDKGGHQPLALAGRMRGHRAMVVACAFSPGAIAGRQVRLCSGSLDKSVLVWDLESGAELHRLEQQEKLLGCAFSVCGHFVGAVCLDNSVTLWDVSGDSAEQVERHETSASSAVNVMGGAFTEKGELIAFLCRDPERASVEATLFLPPPRNKRT